MAILAVLFAIYCVKNTAQDLMYAITGRVPPSFVREQRRMQMAREALAARANTRSLRQPITPNRGHRKFFRNAYNDAWETAEERRARWADNRAKKRRQKWADKDGVPAPIETDARPEEPAVTPSGNAPSANAEPVKPDAADMPKPMVHDDYSLAIGGEEETLYQRYAMRRRNGGQPTTATAVADELGTTVIEAEKLQTDWARRYDQGADPDAQCPTPREQHDQQVQHLANHATQDTREDDRPDGSTSSTKENELTVNAETTGLQSALAYTSAMAETTGDGVSSVETSIASLQQGEVGDAVTGHLTQAQEHLTAAQAAFQAANTELTQHINVQEAYSATPDAGNKAFVTAE